MKNLLIYLSAIILLGSCAESIVPQYTSVNKLTSVNAGMTKAQVLSTLTVYPYDILQNQNQGCEIHVYNYKHLEKRHSLKTLDKSEGLTQGSVRYKDAGTAYVIFRKGKVEAVYSDVSKKDLLNLISNLSVVEEACGNVDFGLKKGCTDPESFNYDPEAIVDDNTCAYCDCGYYRNPEYDLLRPKKKCEPCLKIPEPEKVCSDCDMIEKLTKSGSTINLKMNMNGRNNGENSVLFLNNTQRGNARPMKKGASKVEVAKKMATATRAQEPVKEEQELKGQYSQLETYGSYATDVLSDVPVFNLGLFYTMFNGNKNNLIHHGVGLGLLLGGSGMETNRVRRYNYYTGTYTYEYVDVAGNGGIILPVYYEPKLNITKGSKFSLEIAARLGLNVKIGTLDKLSWIRNDLKIMIGVKGKKSFAFHYFVGPTKVGTTGLYDGICGGLSFAW